jgi:uncharacterized membrane protein YkvA (DUF1232 family)
LLRFSFSASFPRGSPQIMSEFSSSSPQTGAARWYSGPALWRTLKKVAVSTGRKTLLSALILFYCLKDRDTPAWARGVIIGALGYLILPTDLVPDMIPGAGFGDDWGAIVFALGTVAAYIKDEHKAKAKAQMDRLFQSPKADPPADFLE